MIDLFVYDLGETLINYKGLSLDWSSHYGKSLERAFNSLSIIYDDVMISEAASILLKYNTRINPRIEEISAGQIFNEIIDVLKINPNKNKQLVKAFFDYFQKESEPERTALELLSYLKRNDKKTAVLTDVPYGMPKEFVMNDLNSIVKFIDLVVTSEEVGYRKPSTIGLESILEYFQIDIKKTAYIGNEQKDIEMANKLGVYSILLRPGRDIPVWNQKETIRKLIEVKSLLN